jgi:hypothetical protein
MVNSPLRKVTMLSKRRSGIGLIWAMLVILALCAITSLAVDFGRVQIVKTQLHSAADAAALAAGNVLLKDPNSARTAAVQIAGQNKADGTFVTLDATNDVEFGRWDSTARAFAPLGSPVNANAVRVTARRTTERGNPIALSFAKILGVNTCDASASAVASASTYGFAVVGLDYVTMSGGTETGISTAPISAASNGNVSMSGSAAINGDAHPGVGMMFKSSGGAHVTGSTAPLTSPLVYPNGDPGNTKTANNNLSIPSFAVKNGQFTLSGSQTVTMAPGTFYFTNFTMSGSSTMFLTGPTVIYCSGKFTLSGSVVNNYSSNPQDFRVIMVPDNGVAPGKVDISGSSGLYASVYAPQSAITISGSGHLYGSVIGKSITQSGSATIHGQAAPTKNAVALVK